MLPGCDPAEGSSFTDQVSCNFTCIGDGEWCLSYLVSPAAPVGRDSSCHLNLWDAVADTKEVSLARASCRDGIS